MPSVYRVISASELVKFGLADGDSKIRNRNLSELKSYLVPGPWGFNSVVALAAQIGLGVSRPTFSSLNAPPDLAWAYQYCISLERETPSRPFWNLTCRNADGIYLPIGADSPAQPSKSLAAGSLEGLLSECRQMMGILSERGGLGDRYRLESLALTPLLKACSDAIEDGGALLLDWIFQEVPDVPLTYRSASYLGLGEFREVKLVEDGSLIEASFPVGRRYRIPAEYLLYWKRSTVPQAEVSDRRVVKVRRHNPGQTFKVDVVFEDNVLVTVTALDVLEWCEPEYDNFGGATPWSQDLATSWLSRYGRFRV